MRHRSLRLALAQLGASLAVLAFIATALVLAGPLEPEWVLVLFPLEAMVYVAVGIGAWIRRPTNQVGAILVGGGVAWLVAGLANTDVPALIAAGQIVATVPLAVIIHLLLAFPSGQLLDRTSRLLAAGAYVVAIVLQAPLYLFASEVAPYDVLQLAERPDLRDVGIWIQRGAGIAVVAATAAVLYRRYRSTAPPQRFVLAPLYAYGIVVVLAVPISFNVIGPLLDLDEVDVTVFQLIATGLVPAAFALGTLRGGFARTAAIEDLGAWLGADEPDRPTLRDALARSLGDPSIELLFAASRHAERSSGPILTAGDRLDGYLDDAGGRVRLPALGDGRGVAEIEVGRRPVGAIVYDSSLVADPELVRAAGRVIALALDRERLTANLRASREAVRESRMRIMEAADAERRRIAQDLHDGLQSRLLLLAIEAHQAGACSLRSGIDEAIVELRRFVHGIMPSLLIERGLHAATEDLVDRVPLPTTLEYTDEDVGLSPRVETAAYFVVAESLSNAVKHSGANALRVRIHRVENRLCVEVRDDGVGGAVANGGSGLRGIADRVDALGGHLRVDSRAGEGTSVVAQLPCAS
jgi:signal transduction histidine kinase